MIMIFFFFVTPRCSSSSRTDTTTGCGSKIRIDHLWCQVDSAPNRPTRERPPSTIRLDDRAGRELWDAYVKAKTQDPFLSYRQFASGVVLDGLATHRRREKRSP